MGTRNLTMVIKDEQVKIAQYGQWDGYPGGQGKTALEFLMKADLRAFGYQLDKCKFIDAEKQKEINDWFKSIGVTNGWMDMEQARQFKNKYPFLSRDNGAKILNIVNDFEGDVIWLHDESSFVNDSLYNEWTYVIDLDKNTFEVYTGYNTKPLHKHERFYKETPKDGYYPVKNVAIYHIDDLPSVEEFLKLETVESEEN
jgi:hypothetical protein